MYLSVYNAYNNIRTLIPYKGEINVVVCPPYDFVYSSIVSVKGVSD